MFGYSRLIRCSLAVLALAFAGDAQAQEAIRLKRVAILGGGATLPFEVASFSSVEALSDGRYLVAPLFVETEIAVFDSVGGFLRVIGRSGDGPGEFRSISELLVAPGDSVWVKQSRRMTLLDADLEYVDQWPMPLNATDWALLPDGRMVFAGAGQSRRAFRAHIVDRDGRVVESFAESPKPLTNFLATAGVVSYSPSTGGIWYSPYSAYTPQLYQDGRLTNTVDRDAEWFAPWEGLQAGEGVTTPKRPSMTAVFERPDGLLLTIITVADQAFERNRESLGLTDAEVSSAELPRRDVFDTIIELVDPETGRLVARGWFDAYLRGPIGDGSLLYAVADDDIGRFRAFVYRIVDP